MAYDVVASYLSDLPIKFRHEEFPSLRLRFITAVQSATKGRTDGTITNVAYKDAKATVNMALEKAIEAVRHKHLGGRWRDMTDEVSKFDDQICFRGSLSGLKVAHRAGSATLLADCPYQQEALALLVDALPLVDLFAALKQPGIVTKRVVKPVEERIPGYHPPVVSSPYQQAVVRLLEAVTLEAYDDLRSGIFSGFLGHLNNFLAAQPSSAEVAAGKKPISPYSYFIDRRFPDNAAADIVGKLTRPLNTVLDLYVARDDANQILDKIATKMADEYRMFFVHKNFRKIASVIEAKGGYKTAQTLNHHVSLTGMEGRFRFSFADNSRFSVTNQAVGVINLHGTRFVRYPLTFHDVVLPDGVRMNRPSEPRMNEVFAKAR